MLKKVKNVKAPRLFVSAPLSAGESVTLPDDQGRYLTQVMRLRGRDQVCLFNEACGEWDATIHSVSRQSVVCQVVKQLRLSAQDSRLKGITLAFSPLKPSIMGFLVEKATELGVEDLQPLDMERTQHKSEKQDKWRARTIEAAEQSERLSVPGILPSLSLMEWARDYKGDIFWAHERSDEKSQSLLDYVAQTPLEKVAFLVGPEGGFSDMEIEFLSGLENVHPITLGPSILRAETASLMMLSLWRGALFAR
ncbi:MAG: 16S rRNA (uracil(1498)-N(3))-methyltransferase [bacterium]|nr:16S rRNA (uracil(1498)-N(3))-methyltransferase [bacterium]